MTVVPSDQIPALLQGNDRIPVARYGSGEYVFSTDIHGINRLAKRKWIVGLVKRGSIQKVRLVEGVSAVAARKEANQVCSTHGQLITRMRASAGAKRWRECLDRAKSGQSGTQRSVFVGVAA